nr:MAG TPA: hypothetical protein [Caudoviricetes sp.]DAJ62698.1 MAG TPA: hypothetical protein [Caudoviricetes sp.]DAZ29513.1 MAG TPA: hypothetical protein [Caudoviricetes sp.]
MQCQNCRSQTSRKLLALVLFYTEISKKKRPLSKKTAACELEKFG